MPRCAFLVGTGVQRGVRSRFDRLHECYNGAPVGFTMIAVDGGSLVPGVFTLILADGYRTTGQLAAGSLMIH